MGKEINFGEKKFGFGLMRLPMLEENGEKQVDKEQFCRMMDRFMEEGFCYFDTAHNYLEGKSEIAVRECLVERYPRDSFLLADKLTCTYFQKKEDIRPLFESQLQACGVEYFDFYLHHALNARWYAYFEERGAFEEVKTLKAEGKVRHIGMSFHGTPEVLDQILSEHPEIEFVQLQFNYTDYGDPDVQGRANYEICRKYGKAITIMEPVKGGRLANLSPKAAQVLARLGGGSQASWGLRFAASFEGVEMVLSGMGAEEQMEDNLATMKEFRPLKPEEFEVIWQVAEILRQEKVIPCTACRYCTNGCPERIPIPEIIAALNERYQDRLEEGAQKYAEATRETGKASACKACGQCEKICPQQLGIVKLMQRAAKVFEGKL